MKKILLILVLCSFNGAIAHDEGHGPSLADAGRYGGLVSAVVPKAEASKGAKATLVHKAELARSVDGTTRVYLYDSAMKPLDLKGFETKAVATFSAKVKGKWKESLFSLDLKKGVFTGQMPKPESKPYNIDVTFKENGKELLSAFDNLD